jgi:lipooligosaccharide transport system permease protein
MPTINAWHVVERNALVYRRAPVVLLSGFFEPVFYLLSMTVGVGHLVGHVVGPDGHPLSYVRFVAPGLLAASAMNGAFSESTYQLYIKLIEGKTYRGMLATPVSVSDMAAGEVGWAVFRGLIYSIGFILMALAVDGIGSRWALLALPAALVVCAAFASFGQLLTSYFRTWQDLDYVNLIMMPLFMCSATFFPLATYPRWAQFVVDGTPLYQGVALERALTTGHVHLEVLGHLLYLVLMTVVCLAASSRRLDRRFTS